ncbi:uncharacterized protein LOC129923712 [Biomphalaria glabrata]|uniref:Uncharacterized protein LOC129923712 n=1 Tax=Biomphalaria glabrata TaxID=6526 RepID=A0A9W2ZAX0_BIOGL|nr:uncharacterized protein LOC129923712 [Biomphalaria glabrata]KAI8736868.1 extension-2-like; partial [Biomphalaria glabrata]
MFRVATLRVTFLITVFNSLALDLILGQTSTSTLPGGVADEQTDCALLRLQMSQVFRQTFESKVPLNYLNDLLPSWVESGLPSRCAASKNVYGEFDPSSKNDKGGPLGTLGPTDNIFTTSVKTAWSVEKEFQVKMGENGQTTSIKTQTNESWTEPGVARPRRNSDADVMQVMNLVDIPNLRLRRFVGGMGGGGMGGMGLGAGGGPAPAREITEAEQMMNTLLMFTNFQKLMHAREMSTLRKSVSNDRPAIGNGMYGDSYHGKRRKRESTPHSRHKRFLFGGAEPGDPAPINPLFDVYGMLTGTATDPNTGKPVEFGGDVMRNMATRTFMSFLPLSAQPPPGKEPPEMFKHMASMWYMNTLQNVLNPQPVRPRSYAVQPRRVNGYYGDTLPGKKKKRESGTANEVSSRSKRQVMEVKVDGPLVSGPPKPMTFYNNKVFYGDPLISFGPATAPNYNHAMSSAPNYNHAMSSAPNYNHAMTMFRQVLQRNQKLRQQQEKQLLEKQRREKQVQTVYTQYTSQQNVLARRSWPNSGSSYTQQEVVPSLYIPMRGDSNIQQNVPAQRSWPNSGSSYTQQEVVPPLNSPMRGDSYPRTSSTQVGRYQPRPTYRPVDPFILNPTDNPDLLNQGIDPFIPNPTTTTTTTPEPTTTPPGKRKRRSEDVVSKEENLYARVKRADKNKGNDIPFWDIILPPSFLNGISSSGIYFDQFDPTSGIYYSGKEKNSSPKNVNGPLQVSNGAVLNSHGSSGLGQSNGLVSSSFGYVANSDGRFYPLKPDKSSYISNKGELIYGDRPQWSANSNV